MELSGMSSQMIVGASAAVILLSLLLGWLIGRRTSSENQKYRDIERKLDQVMQDKKAYEDEVVVHFTETAQLLNKLTDSYRDVHNHLSSGVSELCQGDNPAALGYLANSSDPSEIPPQLADVQQPLDYAPKTSPDEKGMLNEEFGLERKQPPQSVAEPEKT